MPRRVISFIGGIDLCDGRYDTHDHPLFRTLQLEHKRDFYQDCIGGVDGEAGGKHPAAVLGFSSPGSIPLPRAAYPASDEEAGGESCTALSPAAGLCLIDAEVPLTFRGRNNTYVITEDLRRTCPQGCALTTASP